MDQSDLLKSSRGIYPMDYIVHQINAQIEVVIAADETLENIATNQWENTL